MINDQIINQRRFLDAKAEEYRGQGYVIFREEPLESVPGFRADLVVRKDGHAKVEKVRTQSSLATSQSLLTIFGIC